MSYKLSYLVSRLKGELITPKPIDFQVDGISDITNPQKGTIVVAEKPKLLKKALESECSVVVIPKRIVPDVIPPKPLIVVEDARLALIELLNLFARKYNFKPQIAYRTTIYPKAFIGWNVVIMANAVIMDYAVIEENVIIYPNVVVEPYARIGANTIIYPNVVIKEGTKIGRNNIIHAGAVIGSDGFGFYDKNGKRYKIPQIGIVVTEENVEIGANTCIDRATIGETRIGANTKIDNLVQIGHNVKVGKNCYIVGQAGIGGSAIIEDNVIIAGQVGIADHTRVGKGSIILAKSGVHGNVPPGSILLGIPAKPAKLMRRIYAALERFPEVIELLKDKLSKTKN